MWTVQRKQEGNSHWRQISFLSGYNIIIFNHFLRWKLPKCHASHESPIIFEFYDKLNWKTLLEEHSRDTIQITKITVKLQSDMVNNIYKITKLKQYRTVSRDAPVIEKECYNGSKNMKRRKFDKRSEISIVVCSGENSSKWQKEKVNQGENYTDWDMQWL